MFSKSWLLFLATIQITKTASESNISPNTSTITSSTTEEAKHNMQTEGSDLLPNSCGISSWFDDFPWMALIEYEKPNDQRDFFCGGSLINKRYVLTSASCVVGSLALNFTILGVRLGEFNLDTDPDCIKSSVRGVQCAPPPIDIQVEEQLDHEGYDPHHQNVYHDISLLRLNKDVEFTETVRPICLPATPEERSRTYVGRRLIVAGWGQTETKRSSSTKLKLRLPVVDKDVCKSTYSKRQVNLLDGYQFCAGGEAGPDACRGDTGNALMVASIDKDATAYWSAVGVVSFGPVSCGMKD